MAEINFGFPCIFQRRVPFPCSQVQSAGSRTFVRKDSLHFIFFFVINDVRGQR